VKNIFSSRAIFLTLVLGATPDVAIHAAETPSIAAINAVSALAALDVPLPAPKAVYKVRDFGATADGATKDTVAFQKALDTCAVNGGGEVVVAAGDYLIGSIQIGDRTILRLEEGAVLHGSSDISDYPMVDVRWEGRWQPGHRGLIYAANVNHTGIVGPGRIVLNSAGTNGPDGTRNPVVLEPVSCNDVRWEGFTVTQGGHWATHPVYCTNMLIKNVTITGNRDGIDVDSCSNLFITGCTITTGDDSISLKSGRGMDGARLAKPCENILISHCNLTGRTFACLGVGSETSGGVRNIRIEHCQLSALRSQAIYIKTRIGRAGGNENISGDDLDVQALTFLRINLTQGGNNSTADDPVEGLVGYPFARDIRFTNIRVACTTLVQATEISALKPMHGLVLENISGTATKGITLANIDGVELKNITVTGVTGALLGINKVTGTGLEGAETIPAPVDPPPGNARGFGPRGGAATPPAAL
jgi:hypothetical protein